ncbi:MAG TPA: hypothetical protein VII35_13745, partial [Steroidobacteraceae bacterium]
NHAQLTAGALAAHGPGVRGWVGNSIEPEFDRAAANIATLEALLKAPATAVVSFASHRPHALELPPMAARRLMGLSA